MAVRVAINGFGRIGRNVFRAAMAHPGVEIVAINDLADVASLAHLLKYDSVHGILDASVEVCGSGLVVSGRSIDVFQEEDPARLPWDQLGVDMVIEATGRFTDRRDAKKHLAAGAAKVIISAPSHNADVMMCLGVNQQMYSPRIHHVVSNASCTTNCLAPVIKVLSERFGIVKGTFNTVHCYTNGQSLQDVPGGDLRRSRAAGLSMIPTTSGAAQAIGSVLPHLKGKMVGMAVRVPTPNVSLIDMVIETEILTCVREVNATLKNAALGELDGVLEFCDLPLVSKDFNGNPASSIVDGLSTTVIGGNMVRVVSWYDNEWGYSNRLVELVEFIFGQEADARHDHWELPTRCMNE